MSFLFAAAPPARSGAEPSPSPAAPVLRRKCACGGTPGPTGECEECRRKRLQRSARAAGPAVAPPLVHSVLASPGRPLDGAVRAEMEPRFGHSFSDVRVHADGRAAESARAVAADAYTVGSSVVFAAGRYAPASAEGRRLIAHELAHVVQQRGAPASIQPRREIGAVDDPAEREAEAAARSVVGGGGTGALTGGGAMVRRAPAGFGEESDVPDVMGGFGNPWETGRTGRGGTRAPGESIGYREATEYSECLRIMGAENTDYCRQTVLGEKPPAPATRTNPLADLSTFQSPGASGWWGARFGCYRNACTRRHRGWDVHASVGTVAYAAESGTVTHHNDPGGYGTYIQLASTTNPGLRFLYGHLSAREPAGTFSAGAQIGLTGISGNASADRPHLHFEVSMSGAQVDPAGYFTEPTQVIEAAGSVAAAIDKTLPAPCNPC
jgi:hypothetical protein